MTSEMYSVKAMEMILEGFRRIALEGADTRLSYLDEYVTASLYAGVAFLKAGCATVHAMSFPLGGTYHVPHGESNYALFGKILEIYDEYNPEGELGRFKEIVARCLGCTKADALRTLNVTLEKVLPLKPLHEYGFTEADITGFPVSVMANQQRLVTNSYAPMTLELMERIYRECF
ncbi:MAG: iron-containing alcohol dehydrogenase, partial [Butyricicoccus sp.]